MKAVVAGAGFGRFYARGLRQRPEFELVGILGRGGPRSAALAGELGVPCYSSVGELPPDVRVACVVVRAGVVGGRGSELAAELLARGVHVLQEQPVHHDEAARCLRLAREHGVQYQVNAFYPHLEPVARFLAAAARLRTAGAPLFLDAACAVQVAYPMADLLARTLGGLRPWALEALPAPGPALRALADGPAPFRTVQGVVAGVPVTLRVQNEINPDDPDNHGHFLHRLTLGLPGGTLALADTHGPVVWTPRLHLGPGGEPSGPQLDLPTSELLGPPGLGSYTDVFTRAWPAAAAAALGGLHRAITRGADPLREGQLLLATCRFWQELTARLGQPDLVRGADPDPVAAHRLLEATP
ncbi:thiazolinyl imide reductase [Crossiella equi]|uniref:Thiazolinyl imide reductase n=1 Tax=Crossiella equi TaxID=130796 RepID=A0ABS5A883_9PSEU|nr:Gfo/Idh/MocA family oxidoreductase [Crossiella equi]MBP2472792.1 thiazolinyl imide reductase [Crossiella equi]